LGCDFGSLARLVLSRALGALYPLLPCRELASSRTLTILRVPSRDIHPTPPHHVISLSLHTPWSCQEIAPYYYPPLNKCPVGPAKYGNGGVILEDSGKFIGWNNVLTQLTDPRDIYSRGGIVLNP